MRKERSRKVSSTDLFHTCILRFTHLNDEQRDGLSKRQKKERMVSLNLNEPSPSPLSLSPPSPASHSSSLVPVY